MTISAVGATLQRVASARCTPYGCARNRAQQLRGAGGGLSRAKRAPQAIAANPEKSDRSIAKQIGVVE